MAEAAVEQRPDRSLLAVVIGTVRAFASPNSIRPVNEHVGGREPGGAMNRIVRARRGPVRSRDDDLSRRRPRPGRPLECRSGRSGQSREGLVERDPSRCRGQDLKFAPEIVSARRCQ